MGCDTKFDQTPDQLAAPLLCPTHMQASPWGEGKIINRMFEQKLLFHIQAPLSGVILPPQTAVYKYMPLASCLVLTVRRWEIMVNICVQL